MPLGVISRVSFGFGVIFGENSQKEKNQKIGAKRVPIPMLCSTLSWNYSNSALNILFTSLVKASIMNFMSIPPITPLDASLFDILLQSKQG